MISLRKHIDSYQEALTESSLEAFRSALIAMAECGGRAVPGAGAELNQKLAGIQMGLSKPPITPGLLSDATDQVNAELSAWAERAFQHHQENEREIREIIGAVARAAESVGDRGEKYTKEIGELAAHLRGIADLEDIALIRRSIVESTKALKTCVEKIAQESRHSVEDLSAQIVEYRRRLKESEKISRVDSLTELANRRSFEREMEVRISLERPFCLVMIDMNNFKGVNDRYGHIAGDDLLRQFAMELRGQFTDADLVARWGGDEFVVIASGNLQEGKARVERVQRWVLGEYKINTGAGAAKVPVDASIGIVQWNGRETATQLLDRADKSVYVAKSSSKSSAKTSRATASI